MVASSGASFLSPPRAPRVAHDCRPHTCSSSHTSTSLGSPNHPRSQALNPFASPTSRRTVRACSALPFGFPSFGFPSFGSPSGSSQPQPTKAAPNANEVEWILTADAPIGGCDSEAGVGGVAAAGNANQHPPQSARRRLNLPPLTSPQAATSASTSATATATAVVTSAAAGVEAIPSVEAGGWAPGEQQQLSGGAGGSRRGSPLPYPWRLSEEEEEDLGGDLAGGWSEGAGGGPRPELDVRQLPQLLAQLRGDEDDDLPGSSSASSSTYSSSAETETDLDSTAQQRSIRIDTSNSISIRNATTSPADDVNQGPASFRPRPSARRPAALRQRRRQQLQRALLDQLHSGLAAGRLRPAELLEVPGLLPFLTAATGLAAAEGGPYGAYGAGADRWQVVVSERGVNASTGVALECICTLLSEDSLPAAALAHRPELEQQLVAAVEAAVGVLRAARLPSAVNAPPHNPPAATTSPQQLAAASAAAAGGSGGIWADGTAEAYGWSADVSAAFFAASLLVRAARLPALAEAAVAAGGLGLLVRLMCCRPTMLAQMAVFATYKLVRQPPPAAAAAAVFDPHAAADDDEAGRRRAEREREWRDAALLAVAQSGGMGALCGCLEALEDRPSRDMASSLMLDMALVQQVPAVVAGLHHMAPLVRVMGSRRCDPIARMYALLVLARLANHSAECQMDAVREGAVEPLLSLVRRGCEEEQTHACRLLAILAQAVPTHGRIKAMGVVPAVLPLLRGARGSAAVVAEHACSVLAVLAQNPDMHFHIVGSGAVPAMVPLLAAGTEKARTYVLASLMLLCEQEERHAAVVVRAGALPSLVAMVATVGAGSGAQRGSILPPTAAAAAAAGAWPSSPSAPGAASAPQRSVASTQEFATAVVCGLSRYVDVQSELLACGALLALVRCLGEGPHEAAVNAAEALVHLATGDAEAKRIIAGDAAASGALLRLLTHPKPAARYWALQLLRAVSTDDAALRMAAGLPFAAEGAGGEGQPGESVVREQLGDDAWEVARRRGVISPGWTGPSAVAAAAAAAAASFGILQPNSPTPVLQGSAGQGRGRGGGGGGGGSTARAEELVSALVRLLRWSEPEGQPASWQQGRCRVLAGWLLARMCGLRECAPLLLAAGAVRELMGVLAEEQQRAAAMAAAAAAAAAAGRDGQWDAPAAPPLLSGEGGHAGGDDSGTEGDVDEEDAEGRGQLGNGSSDAFWPGAAGGSMDLAAALGAGFGGGVGGGGGSSGAYPRRVRFDLNSGAAATAALLSVARTGRDGRLAVMTELALVQWMGIAVQLDELDKS